LGPDVEAPKLDGGGLPVASVTVAAGADCVLPLAAGLGPNKLGADAVVLGAEVADAELEGGFPPKPPKSPDVEVAGAAPLGAAVVVLLEAVPNRPGVEEGVEEAADLRPPKRLEPPVAGVEDSADVFGVPKRLLPAVGADDEGCEGCDTGVLVWKLNDGAEALAAVVGVVVAPELAGVDEFRLPNKLLDPPGFMPKSPLEVVEVPGNNVELLAGVCAEPEAFGAPNNGVCWPAVPKRLLPAGFDA
jgi:hypothetical protein